jgi:hypothetical protein
MFYRWSLGLELRFRKWQHRRALRKLDTMQDFLAELIAAEEYDLAEKLKALMVRQLIQIRALSGIVADVERAIELEYDARTVR